MKSIFCVIEALFITLFLLSAPVSAFALEEFTTTMISTYVVEESRPTKVSNEIRIKNNISTIYSTQYALEVGSPDITSIRAYAEDGTEYAANVSSTEKKTSIALRFPDRLLGRDKERVFFIEYEHPDIAFTSGKVLEVDVPKLSQSNTLSSYVVQVKVPNQFSQPSAIKPAGYQVEEDGVFLVYRFLQGAEDGIHLLFGDEQHYSFMLHYHLQNPTVSQGISQIALPPDTPTQRVVYESINPLPQELSVDADGNWIATYTLEAQKELTVTAKGTVTLFLHPQLNIPSEKPGKEYVEEKKYWEVTDPKILELARLLQTPQEIYTYLTEQYQYDYGRLSSFTQLRKGAAQAIETPETSLCQEFTDSFIALSRAAGIPARELNGFAYTKNPRLRPLSLVADMLHAWPEYYDEQERRWIQVDPTWGNTTQGIDYFTKLDVNHFVFAIHGLDSERPYPAGLYKLPGKEQKDVLVEVANQAPQPTLDIQIHPPSLIRQNVIEIENKGGAAWYDVPVEVIVSPELSLMKAQYTVSVLPYQRLQLPIEVGSSNIFTKQQGTVTISIGTETITYETTAGSLQPFLFVALGLGVSAALAGSVLVFKRKR